MDWIEPFYTKRSEWMGPTGIFASHRVRAASIERYSDAGKKRILELGAGAGKLENFHIQRVKHTKKPSKRFICASL